MITRDRVEWSVFRSFKPAVLYVRRSRCLADRREGNVPQRPTRENRKLRFLKTLERRTRSAKVRQAGAEFTLYGAGQPLEATALKAATIN